MIYKTQQKKLIIEQIEHHEKSVISDASEE